MTTNSTVDRLVDDYLARLAAAAQVLPLDRRSELLSEIGEHIAASGARGAGADEAAVRTMLDRLGEPADIVAAAMDDDPPEPLAHARQTRTRRRGIGLEVGAVVMLTLGSLIPIFGWAVGVILLWNSRLWRRSEKLLGTLIVPGGPGLVLILGGAIGMATTQTCSAGASSDSSGQVFTTAEVCTGFALAPAVGIPIFLFVLVAPVVVAGILLNRARSRAALEND